VVDVDERTVVWSQRSGFNARIQAYNRDNCTFSTLWQADPPTGSQVSINNVVISSSHVVWDLRTFDGTTILWEVYALNRLTGVVRSQLASGHMRWINLSGGLAVFDQRTNTSGPETRDIVLWDIEAGTTTVLASGEVCCADIYGARVVYSDGNAATYLIDLNSGSPAQLLPFSAHGGAPPRISGHRIGYVTNVSNSLDFYVHDIDTGTSTWYDSESPNKTGLIALDISEDVFAWFKELGPPAFEGEEFSIAYVAFGRPPQVQTIDTRALWYLRVSGLSLTSTGTPPEGPEPWGGNTFQVTQLSTSGPPTNPGRPFPKKPE
jgi:hypothetical protein